MRAATERRRVLDERHGALERRGVVTVGATHGHLRRERPRRIDRRDDRPHELGRRERARRVHEDLSVCDLAHDAIDEERAAARHAVEVDRRPRQIRRRVGQRAPHGDRRVHRRDRGQRLGLDLRAAIERVGPQQRGERVLLQAERAEVAQIEHERAAAQRPIRRGEAERLDDVRLGAPRELHEPFEPGRVRVLGARPVLEREPGRREDPGHAERIDEPFRSLPHAPRARVRRRVKRDRHVEPELAREILTSRPGEEQARAHRPPRGEPAGRAIGDRRRVVVVEHRRRREQQTVVEAHAGQAERRLARARIGGAVTQPARHPDLAAALAVGPQRLAQPEHARRHRDLSLAPARIPGRRREPEQLRVREHAALGVDVPRDARVGLAIAVEVDGLSVEVDVDVAVPSDPDGRRPVVRVSVHGARDVPHRFVGTDVLERLVVVLGAPGARPKPWIYDAFQRIRRGRRARVLRRRGCRRRRRGRLGSATDAQRNYRNYNDAYCR